MSGDLARKDVQPHWKAESVERPAGAKKRAFRKRAGKDRWEQIVAAKAGPCRVCEWAEAHDPSLMETVRWPISYHHLVARSLGGDDRNDNIIPLCGDGTRGHHGMVEARHREACEAVARSLTDAEYAYVANKGGETFLERRYYLTYESATRPSVATIRQPPKMKSLGSAIDPRANRNVFTQKED